MTRRLYTMFVLLAGGLSLAAVGCGVEMEEMIDPPAQGAGMPGSDPSPEPPTPFGVWRMSGSDQLMNVFGASLESRILVLNEDGTGHWTLQHVGIDALIVLEMLYALEGNSLRVFFSGAATGLGQDLTARYTVVLDGASAMRLVGEESMSPAFGVEGKIILLAREPAVPDAFRMRSVQTLARFDGLNRPDMLNSNLVSDGQALIYQTPDLGTGFAQRIAPDTGAVLETFSAVNGTFYHIHTMQDDKFWAAVSQGSTTSADLRLGSSLFDSVDTVALGDTISIRAMAFDPVAKVLWMQGSVPGQSTGKLLMVDVVADPKVVLKTSTFHWDLAGMTWDGTHLWAVSSSVGMGRIYRIDVVTSKVIRTYRTPDVHVDWKGIAFHGNRLFLLGADGANQGVIVELAVES